MLTRRRFNQFASHATGAALFGGAFGLSTNISLAANPTDKPLHGISAFGELKYKPNYTHFDYVNPEAPKGGTMVFQPAYWYFNQNVSTFNTFNSFVLKGDAPPRMEYCFNALMARAIDEPDSYYGMLAEWVEISEDRNQYRFKIREEARFHDGSALTAEDVAFTFELFKKEGHPSLQISFVEMVSAVASSDNHVTLIFNGKQSDRVVLNVVQVPILSKAYYSTNAFDASSMTPPLGSGAYKVGKFSAGAWVEYERVENYWAKDMPFNIGLNNFDRLRIEFYSNRDASFEAFKKGKIHLREEFTSKSWATNYDFPAINEGKVIKKIFAGEQNPRFQAWVFNTRRQKFSDPRTRQAIGLCFDFEWTNKNIFYSAYKRAASLFENSDLKAKGMPSEAEFEILEPYRDKLPQDAYGEAIIPMKSDSSGNDRKPLRQALSLLVGAGWKREEGKLVDAEGKQLAIEFLIRSSSFERLLAKFIQNLTSLGINATIRLVDASQYQARLDGFDYDIIMTANQMTPNVSAETLRLFLHSSTAEQHGSRNYAGIKNPIIDQLIEEAHKADSHKTLRTAARALDRVLRSYHYFIPNWYSDGHRMAYWDRFGYKEPKPDYFFPVEQLWWQDEEKAKKLDQS